MILDIFLQNGMKMDTYCFPLVADHFYFSKRGISLLLFHMINMLQLFKHFQSDIV